MKSPTAATALTLMLCFVTGLFMSRPDIEARGATLPSRADADYDLRPLLARLRPVVVSRYPRATFTSSGGKLHFAHRPHPRRASTRTALVSCDIELKRGRPPVTRPAAAIETSGRLRTYRLSPYSPRLNAYLAVSITSPRNAPAPLLPELTALVNDFDKSVVRS